MIRTFARWQDVDPPTLRGHFAVVIDVLRWSTVVVTALERGASWVEACETPDEARTRADRYGRGAVLLGGERGNVAIPGFDVGNSPFEYTSELIANRPVITTTTNGTMGLAAARDAQVAIVGGFVNLPSVVSALADGIDRGMPIALVACGQAGAAAEEDLACAGAIATSIGALVADATTEHACALWAKSGRDARRAIRGTAHAASLVAAGFSDDVEFAGAVGTSSCVPRRDGSARLIAS